MFQSIFLQLVNKTQLQVTAPLAGGGYGFYLWAERLAPVFAIIAALFGIYLGYLAHRMKKQEHALRMKQLKSNGPATPPVSKA